MGEPLSWTVHRASETPIRTAATVVFILAFVAFSWVVFGPMLAILAVVVLFVALNTYFLPVTYTFTDKGIEVDKQLFSTRYEWKQFRRWFRTSGGIVISPFSRKNYLDNFRGVHLLLPADTSKAQLSKLEYRHSVRTQDIVAYLEKRFAPPRPDDRLRLDDEPQSHDG
jgi:hypothetical protein